MRSSQPKKQVSRFFTIVVIRHIVHNTVECRKLLQFSEFGFSLMYVFNLLGRFGIFIRLRFLVLAIYSKSPGKNSKHCWVTDSSNITAVSDIAAQLFEQMVGSQFRAIHASQKVHAKRFNLLPSSAFLCRLESTPTQISGNLRVSSNDWDLFKTLKEKIGIISQAVSRLNASLKSTSRRRAGAADVATSPRVDIQFIHLLLVPDTNYSVVYAFPAQRRKNSEFFGRPDALSG